VASVCPFLWSAAMLACARITANTQRTRGSGAGSVFWGQPPGPAELAMSEGV
jgi:hypothetical protein